MTESTASVYRENGRVFVRMELSDDEYEQLLARLLWANRTRDVGKLMIAGERERADRSDIMERFDDNPKLGDD